MTPEEAGQLVGSARSQASTTARTDVAQLRDQAVQAGKARAGQLFPAGRRTVERSIVNARGARILRDWYATTFTAAVRDRLGDHAQVPAATEVDATAAALRRALGARDPDQPLRMAGSLHQRALADAAAASASAQHTLTQAATRRATAHVARQPPLNEPRTAILEQWYQRCYRAAVDGQLGLLQPLQMVTAAEAREVAASVEAGQARRIIGADGIPLVTAHGTAMTEVDRRLAAGETGVVDPPRVRLANALLRARVTQSWDSQAGAGDGAQLRATRRREWAETAGIPAAVVTQSWKELTGDHQTRLIASWLDTHQDQPPRLSLAQPAADQVFRAEPIPGPPQIAAAAMFNQPTSVAAQARDAGAPMFPTNSSNPPTRRANQVDTTQARPAGRRTTGRNLGR